MKKVKYISIALLTGCCSTVSAYGTDLTPESSLPDTLSVGYWMNTSVQTGSYSVSGVNSEAMAKSPFIDMSKALYGKIAGLNVYQGTGSSADNISGLSIHGQAPLILVDGFPRAISDVIPEEVESVYVLKDAAAAAIYGMKGGNGVIMITTKRGTESKLKITAQYHMGINTQFRSPKLADAYTYATSINQALVNDGLSARYNDLELDAFSSGLYPYEYPNVNWWDETLRKTGFTNNLLMTVRGGNSRFRYYTMIDYYYDRSMLKENTDDDRYSTKPTDTRLSVRTNIDVNLTPTTYMKLDLSAKIQELRGTRYGRNAIFNTIYNTPAAAFPIKHANGIYGGNTVFGANNPVGRLKDYGHIRNVYSTLLANLSLRQDLDMLTKGLGVEVAVSFDNMGAMNETTSKDYRYMSIDPTILSDGTLVTTPVITGKDSETLGHSQPFERLWLRNDFYAKADYNRTFGKHDVHGAFIFDMQSSTRNYRNQSTKNMSMIANVSYTYDNRYSINGVFTRAGSSYLPEDHKWANYAAGSAAWILSNEAFMKDVTAIDLLKISGSYGTSGWDGNLSHELWQQNYEWTSGYVFGTGATAVSGMNVLSMPVIGLVPERSEKSTVGIDLAAFGNRLNVNLEGFNDVRSNILVSGANTVSGIMGISVSQVNAGKQKYMGFDASVSWSDRIGQVNYTVGANMSYLTSEIINANQAYQAYDYLYTKGNRVGQMYGLEAIGFFNSQQEINNSPQQTFSTVRPGDVKYKDQNGDNVIDSQDVVKMFGSSLPRFYFGFNFDVAWNRFELSADFQGMTGITVSRLDSPLYQPLTGNTNISQTFLDREVCWTPATKANATMPRLTTLSNENNYRASSLWYRDGSFIKLRNLMLSYTLPKSIVRVADLKIFVQGTNLFSLDNIGFADPEQLGIAYPSTRSYWAGVKFNF